MDDAPPQKGGGVGQIRNTKHLMGLRGLFSSLRTAKTVEPNLVIMVVFLVALGLRGWPQG